MKRALASILFSQTGWIVVAMLAARGRTAAAAAAAAAFALVIVLIGKRRGRTALFAAAAAVLGPIADLPLVRSGLLILRDPLLLGVAMPLWWWGLWAMFAAAIPAAFGWMRGRPALGALLGAIGGPSAYFAGSALGAISLRPETWTSLLGIGVVWALVLPLAVHIAGRVVPPREAAP